MTRPLQVYLDDADHDRLERWSRARGWTKSQTIRAAVRALVRADDTDDPLLAVSGMIDGLPPDASTRFDQHLDATFVAERPPAYRGTRPRPTNKPTQRPRR
ncbi:MAG: hypothetical protein IT294_06890 [Deltaproteobacteria bacterium]|nr:hypothetical protein [Deltaproteobacteria bacterium]